MADILIRGMEMPKHCIGCPCMVDKYGGDDCCLQSEEANEKITSWDDMKAGCPLHELPEHGDLIDRDEIIEQIAETPFTMSMFQTVKECRAAIDAKEVILNVVAYADAVIPSNKERSEDA